MKDEERDAYKVDEGLTEAIVEQISREKKDPLWMELFRLQALQIYNEMPVPDWGPSIEGLDMSHIVTYVRPNTKMTAKWSDVPQEIKDTFERLVIPQAERKSLAGVGAQYDSELVYHNVREEVAAQGVVYTDMESALKGEYADMVQSHFMKLVKPNDHKFAALHGAVWSGGSFVYVPPGVSVTIPLQSYFRLNAPGAGQFEHTLIIVDKGRICILSRAVPHKIQCGEPPCGLCGTVCRGGRDTALFHDRELVEKYVQSEPSGRWSRRGDGSSGCPAPSAPMYLYPWYLKGKRGAHGIHRHHVCRKRSESGHRGKGGACRTGYLLVHEHQVDLQGRRDQHLPEFREHYKGSRRQQIGSFLSVADAR